MTGSRARRSARAQALERWRRHCRLNALARPGVHPLVVVLDHLKPNFNVAKILRSAQVFGVREVHLIGIGPFDPAPAKGALKAVPVRWLEDFADSHSRLAAEGYRISLLAPGGDAALPSCELPARTALVLGHEEHGFSFDAADYPDIGRVGIPQYGPTDSLNVSIAASIAMYEYVRRHGDFR